MLEKLLEGVQTLLMCGDKSVEISSLGFDSRAVKPGMLFFAVCGVQSDGHQYIESVIEKGATAVVCQKMPDVLHDGVTYVEVADSNIAMGIIAANFYDNPSRKLNLVGITGTNGKTTTATLLYNMFRRLGYKAGLISTVVYCIDNKCVDSTHTTPDAIRLNQMLAEMVDVGCQYCFMEVSSHSIVQNRIGALSFVGGVFTNITHDHLDYHKTFAEYIRAKKMFFDALPVGAFALVNADDRNGMVMVQNTKAAVRTYSLQGLADYRCKISEMLFDGMLLTIDKSELWVKFLGRFNAYNLLSVYAVAVELGADKDEVLTIMSTLSAVNGRFEYVRSNSGITAIVDYAHTPDALQNVIDTINEIRAAGQKLFVVVGCGGNRDATKRPVMAKIAASNSDLAILTSDNPRLEDPQEILKQMQEGVDRSDRFIVIADRREAIKTAVLMASPSDIILVAGKGHETYQDVQGVKHHFDDKEEVITQFQNI